MTPAGLDPNLAAFLAFTFLLVVTPGSTTAVVVRNTLEGGRRAGVAAAFGAAIGNTLHATAAGVGLSVLVARWPALLQMVRFAGAVYLAWLGVQSLRVAFGAGAPEGAPYENAAPAAPVGRHFSGAGSGATREGLISNLLNPAIISYYIALVPSFIPAGASQLFFPMLAAIHVTMALACHTLWALALDRVRRWLGSPAARRALEAITGAALILLAARVVWVG